MIAKLSTFGGPNDKGMLSDTGLSFYEPKEADKRPDLFNPACPENPSEPTWRRLKTHAHYVALRIDTDIPREIVQRLKVKLTNPSDGTTITADIVDRGPWANGRDIDISEAAAAALGVQTDDRIEIVLEPQNICRWIPKKS